MDIINITQKQIQLTPTADCSYVGVPTIHDDTLLITNSEPFIVNTTHAIDVTRNTDLLTEAMTELSDLDYETTDKSSIMNTWYPQVLQ